MLFAIFRARVVFKVFNKVLKSKKLILPLSELKRLELKIHINKRHSYIEDLIQDIVTNMKLPNMKLPNMKFLIIKLHTFK